MMDLRSLKTSELPVTVFVTVRQTAKAPQRKPLRGLALGMGLGGLEPPTSRLSDGVKLERGVLAHAKTRAGTRFLIERRNPLFHPVRRKPSKKSSKSERQDRGVHRSTAPFLNLARLSRQ